jgi:hypothetical protein
MLASAGSSAQSNQVHKIHDVRHVEGLNDVDNTEEIDEIHKLSESGLTDKQKQQIMDEKSITTRDLEIDIWRGGIAAPTVVLTTDNSLYIADIEETSNTTSAETIMSIVGLMLLALVVTGVMRLLALDCE